MTIQRTSADLYEEYKNSMQKTADLKYAAAVLQWDQETYLPKNGADRRGRQLATLTELAHERFTEEKFSNLLQELKSREDLSEEQKRNVELTSEDHERQVKLPSEFVRELTEAINRSFHSWILARKENSFRIFSPDLALLVALKKQEAEMIGYASHPYNAMLDEYDKGSNVGLLDSVFNSIQKPLYELIDKIKGREQVDRSILTGDFPKDRQWEFGMKILRELHYDFDSGRQDISEHPFTTSFSSNDVRITTRIDEKDLGNMTWSCIHELGHALYEQGLPDAQYGLPLGEAASLTIHESQSRLWENHIGRSLAFAQKYLPVLQEFFPDQLGHVQPTQFYKAINAVQPSLIRTEADELTYHFHVMIRYELEKQLIGGSINTSDIPAFWNEQYKRLLGVIVPDDVHGCLQDVHWSHGSFGYFPTYSLGSFYSAQFFSSAIDKIPGLDQTLGRENTLLLLDWLRENIHQYGRKYSSSELSAKVSGEELNVDHFLNYAHAKYSAIYDFN